MEWITDRVFFYGGIALAVIALAALMIYLLAFKIGTIRLEAQMDKEYGAQKIVDKH